MWVVTFQHLPTISDHIFLHFLFKSNILSIHTTINKNICWESCAINHQCNWFSYDQGSNQCLHFEFCPEIDENPRFISGEKECKYQIYSMWNSIAFINFYDSVIKVKIFTQGRFNLSLTRIRNLDKAIIITRELTDLISQHIFWS